MSSGNGSHLTVSRDAVHRYMDSNMQTVYYSLGTGYTTNPANSVPFSMYNDDTSALMLKSLEQNQILIGMTGMRTKPRAEAVKVGIATICLLVVCIDVMEVNVHKNLNFD